MLCYHKEAFAVGFLGAFFIFAIVTLFEELLKNIFEKYLPRVATNLFKR